MFEVRGFEFLEPVRWFECRALTGGSGLVSGAVAAGALTGMVVRPVCELPPSRPPLPPGGGALAAAAAAAAVLPRQLPLMPPLLELLLPWLLLQLAR